MRCGMPVVRRLRQHKMILDTHVWIWVMMGNPNLRVGFRRAFAHSLKNLGVLISPLSVLEVGMLVEKKRIVLDRDVQEWIDEALDLPGMRLSTLTARTAT